MNRQNNPCLHPECKEKQYSRGLCFRHYRLAWDLVRRGGKSWKQFESQGKSLPKKRFYFVKDRQWFLTEKA